MSDHSTQRRLAAILAADVVGYTRLMEEDSDATVNAWKSARDSIIDPTITSHSGRTVKLTGDGFLAEFPTVQDAVNCAIKMQEALKSSLLDFRMGVNLGDIIDDGKDIHGEGVNVAARIEALADSGGINISGSVYEQVRNRIETTFEDRGEQSVKNVSAPVRVYSISFHQIPDPVPSSQERTITDKPSIAVLPFDNLSGDPEQEYFSDGITEDIITALSHIRQFFVVARNSSFSYKGKSPDIRKVSEDLGVRYVLEGSVRKAGNRVRITAQLIEGESGNHLWAEKYDRELEDIFAVQDEITQTVVGALHPELTRSEIERARRKLPDNLDAWDLYQRGLWHYFRITKKDFDTAIDLFSKAIELDPDFVHPQVSLAECLVWGIYYGFIERDREEVLAIVRKAVEIAPEDANAHTALGFYHYQNRDHASAIAEYKMAIQLNPNAAQTYAWLGFAQSMSGLAEDGQKNFRLAINLSPRDPLSSIFYSGMALSSIFLRRHEESIEWARKTLQHPHFPWQVRLHFVSALGQLGLKEEIKSALTDLLKSNPDFSISFVKQWIPITDNAYRDHYFEGFRKAGLSE